MYEHPFFPASSPAFGCSLGPDLPEYIKPAIMAITKACRAHRIPPADRALMRERQVVVSSCLAQTAEKHSDLVRLIEVFTIVTNLLVGCYGNG
jgi:hypothetical protein